MRSSAAIIRSVAASLFSPPASPTASPPASPLAASFAATVMVSLVAQFAFLPTDAAADTGAAAATGAASALPAAAPPAAVATAAPAAPASAAPATAGASAAPVAAEEQKIQAGLVAPGTAPTIRSLPDDWYPESLAAGPDGTLYVGSWRQGAVARLKPGDAAPEILVQPGSNGLANAQGLLVDAARRRLWVCSGTMGFTTVAMTPSALKSYDLVTGAAQDSHVLPDAGYCNDLAQSADGTIYVTDSLHPRILALSPGDKALRVWLEDPMLGSGDAKYYLNGIAIDPRAGLFVSVVMATPYLLRVDVHAGGAPGKVHRLPAPRTLRNVDAVRFLDERHLLLFESNAFGADRLYGGLITVATLAGDRIEALRTLAAGLNDPSSGLILGGQVWYIESKYGLLLAHPDDDAAVPRQVPFQVRSVPLVEP